MCSIVSCILQLSFGLLLDKLRDHAAEKLREGDLTDEKCRQFFVRELDDIKSKLDGLSRKDLLSSVSFLKEGICFLYASLADQEDHDKTMLDHQAQEMTGSKRRSEIVMEPEDSYFQQAFELSSKIKKLDINSKKRFASAHDCFCDARKEATRAFNNTSLNTADRIMAAKLRVINRILESLDDPVGATSVCKLYLVELHQLEAVQEIFSVHYRGGLKSRFNKRKRLNIMASIIIINYVLCYFSINFAKKEFKLVDWPTIKMNERMLHPILDAECQALMNNYGLNPPNKFTFSGLVYPIVTKEHDRRIMNEIMSNSNENNIIEVICNGGEIYFTFHSTYEMLKEKQKILHEVTTDKDDIYLVTYFNKQNDYMPSFVFVMCVSDVKGRIKIKFHLEFLTNAENKHCRSLPSGAMAEPVSAFIANNVELVIVDNDTRHIFGHLNHIYISNNIGQLLYSFQTIHNNEIISIHQNNIIISVEFYGSTVYGYCLENGEEKHQFEIARGGEIHDLVFNSVKNYISILTYSSNSFQLRSYSVFGELLQTIPLHFALDFRALSVLPDGIVAVIHKKGFILT